MLCKSYKIVKILEVGIYNSEGSKLVLGEETKILQDQLSLSKVSESSSLLVRCKTVLGRN